MVGKLIFSEQDARVGLLDLSGQNRWYRLPLLLSIIMVPLLVASAWQRNWSGFLPILVVWAVLGLVGPLGIRRYARRLTASLGGGETEYRFGADAVTIRAPGSTSTIAYRRFHSAREGKEAFLLFTQPRVAQLVPKRAFSPEDIERVRVIIATKIMPKKGTGATWKLFLLWATLIAVFFIVWQLTGGR